MTDERWRRELPEDVRRFAATLRVGTAVSLGVLAMTFAVYVTGLVPPLVPVERLPRYWGLRAAEFLVEVGLTPGWGWAYALRHGDVLNYLGVVMLGVLAIVAYAAMLPALVRRRETAYVIIVVAQLVILLLAASGLVAVGH